MPRQRLIIGVSGSSAPQLGWATLRALHRHADIETQDLLTFPWVGFHVARPGNGGQSPPRVSRAMAMRASGLWNP